MKKYLYTTLVLVLLIQIQLLGQQRFSPTYTSPPNVPNVRTMAEWEEIEALVVTWTGTNTGFPNIVREIIRHAKEEVKVIVICSDSIQVKNDLTNFNINTNNLDFVQSFFNSVWIRDYGATSIYGNNVDSLYLVDWIYNRPRPFDDFIPKVVSDHNNLPLYATTVTPWDLVNTGGNFMSDGQGTAFASKLILDENGTSGSYNGTPKTEQQIDSIMQAFMGISNFIKLEKVPFNNINHIDMYMKLLNEETILIGQYPQGVADGPQIEQNVKFIQDNMTSAFGTPYKIVRVPMPPDTCGNYPDYLGPGCFAGMTGNYAGHYRTYTNIVFINKTVLVPIYSYQYDTTALTILRKELSGYKIVGIDCDEMIGYGGALHCITKAVGSRDPLLIVHQPIRDTIFKSNGYTIKAKIQHKSQIKEAKLFYTIDTALGFSSIQMTPVSNNEWEAILPSQLQGSTVQYYISAKSFSDKVQVRPMTAPEGFWQFDIKLSTSIAAPKFNFELKSIFPNPTGDIINIPIQSENRVGVEVGLFGINGQKIRNIFVGELQSGTSLFETSIKDLPSGTYFVVLQSPSGKQSQKVVKN